MSIEKLMTFLTTHWVLALALVGIILLLVLLELRERALGIQRLSPQQLVNMINHENAVIVDIRESNEFNDGHVTEAINLPLAQIKTQYETLNQYQDKPVVIVCKQGQQAMAVVALLRKHNFQTVHMLNGGVKAWRAENLPLVSGKSGKKRK